MLVLTRRMGEELVIGENIHLTVVRVEGGKVRLGVVAPATVPVRRAEVFQKQSAGISMSGGRGPGGNDANNHELSMAERHGHI